MYLDTCTVLPHLGSLEGHALIGKAEQKLQPRYPATIGACPYNQSGHEHLDIGHHQAQPCCGMGIRLLEGSAWRPDITFLECGFFP